MLVVSGGGVVVSAAFGRLRVETNINRITAQAAGSAAFGRLRVETTGSARPLIDAGVSRLRAAAC